MILSRIHMKRQRIASLDLIRTVAILLAILLHVWSELQFDEPAALYASHIYQILALMGVPLFFMLSGGLMLESEPLPIKQFLSRRFKRLLLPYLFWGTLMYAVSVIMHKYPDVHDIADAMRNYVPYLLTGKIEPSYWYVFVFIVLYLLTPFMQLALSSAHTKKLMELLLLLWVVWFTLRHPQFVSMNWHSASGIVYMGFFVGGHYCMRYLTDAHRNRRIGAIGLVLAYVSSVWGVAEGFSVTFVYVAGVASLFLLLKSCAVPDKLSSFITSSGRYAYVIYFLHVPLVDMFCMLDVWGWCPIWICPTVITLLSFIISYFAAWILDRIRFVPNIWVGI